MANKCSVNEYKVIIGQIITCTLSRNTSCSDCIAFSQFLMQVTFKNFSMNVYCKLLPHCNVV